MRIPRLFLLAATAALLAAPSAPHANAVPYVCVSFWAGSPNPPTGKSINCTSPQPADAQQVSFHHGGFPAFGVDVYYVLVLP
jgi:hypothetical protein